MIQTNTRLKGVIEEGCLFLESNSGVNDTNTGLKGVIEGGCLFLESSSL